MTERLLEVSRTLKAPIEFVWEVWTNPQHIAEWWGPMGLTNTINTMEIIPGGEWRLTMKGPEGKTFPNRSIFKEIMPSEKNCFSAFQPKLSGNHNF
jgi:uncharacterized protein YndB with AHSA1/START domain